MTNIMIRYDPQIIFDPKIASENRDLKLIMSSASFEFDPQIHLRILYILFNVVDIKPSSAETSEITIDFLMNIYNFRYVLTMDEEYEFPIQSYSLIGSANQYSREKNSMPSISKHKHDDHD